MVAQFTKNLIVLAAVAACMTSSLVWAQNRPNVVCIMMDNLGWGEIGSQTPPAKPVA